MVLGLRSLSLRVDQTVVYMYRVQVRPSAFNAGKAGPYVFVGTSFAALQQRGRQGLSSFSPARRPMLARHRTGPMTAHRHIHWPMHPTTCTPCDGLQTRGTLFGAVSARLPNQASHKQEPRRETAKDMSNRHLVKLRFQGRCQTHPVRQPWYPVMITDVFMYCAAASYYPPH